MKYLPIKELEKQLLSKGNKLVTSNRFIIDILPLLKGNYCRVYFYLALRYQNGLRETKKTEIIKHTNYGTVTISRSINYFNKIFIYSPNNKYSDSEGNLYLIKINKYTIESLLDLNDISDETIERFKEKILEVNEEFKKK